MVARKDPRIDAFIAAAAPFARPILKHLRKIVHAGCPEVEETIKWGMPHFDYKGMLCGMAAFKAHCVFGFWKASLIFPGDPKKEEAAMGQFGCIKSLDDLPSDKVLIGYVKKAAALNDAGIKSEKKKPPQPLVVPDYLTTPCAIIKKRARRSELSPSCRRIRAMAHGSEARRNAREAACDDVGMARRRQVAQLEIRELLSPLDAKL